MTHQENMEHLANMLNERGYLVVSCRLPETHRVGGLLNREDMFVMHIPTDHPAHIICETDYLDMNAQWPNEPNLYAAWEAKYYRFYRVSLD